MSNTDDFRKLTSLAGIYRLTSSARRRRLFLKALIIQHDCIMVECAMAMEHDRDSNFGSVHGTEPRSPSAGDRAQILDAVDTDFERASPSTVEAYIKTQLENISGAETELDEPGSLQPLQRIPRSSRLSNVLFNFELRSAQPNNEIPHPGPDEWPPPGSAYVKGIRFFSKC